MFFGLKGFYFESGIRFYFPSESDILFESDGIFQKHFNSKEAKSAANSTTFTAKGSVKKSTANSSSDKKPKQNISIIPAEKRTLRLIFNDANKVFPRETIPYSRNV